MTAKKRSKTINTNKVSLRDQRKYCTDDLDNNTAEKVPDTRRDLRVLQAIRQIIRAVDLHSRQLLSKYKLTGPQLVCLLEINKHDSMTVGSLAKQVHLSPSTVIGILDRLESKKLIRRRIDKSDRRRVHVKLTPEGQLLTENAPSPLQDTLADAMIHLPVDKQEMIAESLERVVEMMQVDHIDAAPILETGIIDPSSTVVNPPTPVDLNEDQPLN